jgi:hypothetical protein
MAEHDRLALAPILVEDLDAVFGRDGGHGNSPLVKSSFRDTRLRADPESGYG